MSTEGLIETPYDEESCPERYWTITELFKQHPVKILQQQGLHECSEFVLEDSLVFSAFKQQPFLTLGSSHPLCHPEAVWESHLKHIATKRSTQPYYYNISNNIPTSSTTGVTVEAAVVAIKDAAAPNEAGLLRHLLAKHSMQQCSAAVFVLPAVKAVVEFKWNMYAKKLLLGGLALLTLWALCYILLLASLQHTDTKSHHHHNMPFTAEEIILQVIINLILVPFIALDLTALRAWGFRYWLDPGNALSTMTIIMQLAITGMHLGGWLEEEGAFAYLLASQCIFLLFRILHVTAPLNQNSTLSFVTIVVTVFSEVAIIFVYILLVMIAFGAAMYITLQYDAHKSEEFATLWQSVLSLYEHAYGDLKLEDFYKTDHAIFATILALLYMTLMGFVIVNLLIGMVITALDKIVDREGIQNYLQKAQLIDRLEATACLLMKRDKPEWYPTFIHVLSIKKEALDDVSADAMAAQKNDYAPLVLRGIEPEQDVVEDREGNGASGIGYPKELYDDVAEIKKMLEELLDAKGASEY